MPSKPYEIIKQLQLILKLFQEEMEKNPDFANRAEEILDVKPKQKVVKQTQFQSLFALYAENKDENGFRDYLGRLEDAEIRQLITKYKILKKSKLNEMSRIDMIEKVIDQINTYINKGGVFNRTESDN